MDNGRSWAPESPFLETAAFPTPAAEQSFEFMHEVSGPWAEAETPFARDAFEVSAALSGEVEAVENFLAELNDEEFDAAVYELGSEVAERLAERSLVSNEAMDAEMSRMLEAHFAPLAAEIERMCETVSQGLAQYELSGLSEAQFEALFVQFVPAPQVPLTVPQENFLGKIIKKAGRALKGAWNFAKKHTPVGAVVKGAQMIGRTVIKPILDKIKRFAKPLLKRVLQFAMNRLPVTVRPIAQRLSQRLFGREAAFESETALPLASAASPALVQLEFDLLMAETLLAGPQLEGETSLHGLVVTETGDPIRELYEAQHVLAQELARLGPGQDPRPAIDQFLPAALLALQPILRTAIGVIGRDRVINAIAEIIAKMISRWVGAEPARQLARPVVDLAFTGFGLETAAPTDPRRETAEILAQTVQETITRLAQHPAEMFEEPALRQALVAEALEQAAVANFPHVHLREEVRPVPGQAGAAGGWVTLPMQGQRKYYRKWSRPIEVDLSRIDLKSVEGFNGARLTDVLELSALKRSGKVRVHVYELLLGARLVDIAIREKGVRGLGTPAWESWSMIQPLTARAAAILLGPAGLQGLGADPDPIFLRGPYLVAPSQRFYYIEGAAPAAGGAACANDVGIIVNLERGVITVKMRLSETTSQEIATYLRRGDIATPIQIMRRAVGGLERLRQGRGRVGVRVVGETAMLAEMLDEAAQFDQFLGSGLLARAAAGARSVAGGLADRAQAALGGAVAAAGTAAPAAAALSAGGPGAAAAAGTGGVAGIASIVGEKVLEKVIDRIVDLVWQAIGRYLKNKSDLFIRCAENPASGVTVLVAFEGLTSLHQYRQLKSGAVAQAATGFVTERIKNVLFPPSALPFPSLDFKPGCA